MRGAWLLVWARAESGTAPAGGPQLNSCAPEAPFGSAAGYPAVSAAVEAQRGDPGTSVSTEAGNPALLQPAECAETERDDALPALHGFYYINLDSAAERRAQMEATLSVFTPSYTVERIPAVDRAATRAFSAAGTYVMSPMMNATRSSE